MTNKQKQCLLQYLGYYTGLIDGDFGPASKQATKDFQADYGLDADGIFGPLTEARIREVIYKDEPCRVDWAKVRFFDRSEFKCNCGGKHCNGYPAEMHPRLIAAADRVRGHFGAAALVSSGVRCEKHNAAVGGVANSRHLTGKAMDFRISGKTAAQVLSYVQQQPELRYAYAIDSNYIHMDVE
ncbi:MAG: peptidoglycan-binding protein [Oscillospiraceae bacterium]|nr:peptidoglycan-binding protein [Oscillospiraceae bacterium]